jgi:hypothetical protein
MLAMTPNFISFVLVTALSFAVRSAGSPNALPIVDLGYAVHQATFNKVGIFSFYLFICYLGRYQKATRSDCSEDSWVTVL